MPAISTRKLEKFTRKFGKMLNSGIPLVKSLDLIRKENEQSELSKVIEKVIVKLKEGFTFSSSLEMFPGVFGSVLVAMVKASENKGMLDQGMIEIADNLAEGIIEAGKGEPEFVEAAASANEPHLKVISQVNSLIADAFRAKATRIQFKPEADRVEVSQGNDNQLTPVKSLGKDEYERVLARLKILSCLDIAERRLPQDGRILLKIDGETVDIRTQTLPTVFGEQIMMFFINKKDAVIDPEKVFPNPEDRDRMSRLLENLSAGLVVFSGPNGSGKTTTMLTAANMLNDGNKTIFSIEDQVQYTFDGISHIKIRPWIGLTMAAATRAALRAEPHLLILEGLKDEETAREAFQAAENGTRVFTQMSARNPVDVFKQFLNLKVSSHLLYGGMGAVVFQVLVRKLCPDCQKKIELNDEELQKMNLGGLKAGTYKETSGCETCNNSGYLGRLPLYEFIVPDKNLKDVIIKGEPREISEAVERIQNNRFSQRLARLALEGKTSVFEVRRIQSILNPEL